MDESDFVRSNGGRVSKSWQSVKIKVTKAVIVGVYTYMVKFVGSVSMTECNV